MEYNKSCISEKVCHKQTFGYAKKGRIIMDSLIKLLKGNARLSDEQLAVMLGITPEEVAARIADYEKKGVIDLDDNVYIDLYSGKIRSTKEDSNG